MRRTTDASSGWRASILKNDADAEDALQEAYLQAYRHIGDFRGDAQFGTWLTRIVINQALMRLRAGRARSRRGFLPARAIRRRPSDCRPTCRTTRPSHHPTAALRGESAPHPRAPHRRAAGGVPHRVRDARSRRHERATKRPTCLAHSRRHRPDPAVPGACAAARSAGARRRHGDQGRVRVSTARGAIVSSPTSSPASAPSASSSAGTSRSSPASNLACSRFPDHSQESE